MAEDAVTDASPVMPAPERGRRRQASVLPAVSVAEPRALRRGRDLTIALDALGETYMRLAAEAGIEPALLHQVAAIGSGTLDSLPHNGAVVTLLAVCSATHSKSYLDFFMVAIVGPFLALAAVILLGTALGSF
jgi:hypothetical protein